MERLDSIEDDGNDSNHWKGREIISLNDWIQLEGTPYALRYFPDDFDNVRIFLSENELKDTDEQTRKWYSDYLDLMKQNRNTNFGRTKCFHCLLSHERDDAIFIGINRLVAKGLEDHANENNAIQYPCPVTNRFECPYEKGKGSDERLTLKICLNWLTSHLQ